MRSVADIDHTPIEQFVGTWRRFGPTGPVYEVLGLGPTSGDAERMMRIRVVETGEELDYRLAALLDDPRAD